MDIGEGSMSKGKSGEISLHILDHVDRKKVSSIIYETECCIFRVPKMIHEGSEYDYTPIVVSIGPYHRRDKKLHPMERFKLQCLDSFLDLSTGDEEEDLLLELKEKSKLLLESCVEKILEKKYQIRGAYSEHISLSRNDFVQMVLLDSVFIIWSLGTLSMFPPSVDDIPRLQHKVIKSAFERVKLGEVEIVRDLLLLENQLPLFIIDEIYNIRYPAKQGTTNTAFRDIVGKFLHKDLPPDWLSFGNLLALIRNIFVGSFQSEEQDYMLNIVSPQASHLHDSGVKFKAVQHGYFDNILEIQFDKHEGVLSIPVLNIDDGMESMFRNLIAMEQCMYLYKEPTYIRDYFHFLNCLIDTEEDVELLADQGITPKHFASKYVRDMFNCMNDGTRNAPWNYSYRGVSDDLNAHCNKKWNRYIATLKDKYFSGPWTIISVITAIVLLLLTMAQVILGIFAVPGVL